MFGKICASQKNKKFWNKIGGPNFDRHVVRALCYSLTPSQGPNLLEFNFDFKFLQLVSRRPAGKSGRMLNATNVLFFTVECRNFYNITYHD